MRDSRCVPVETSRTVEWLIRRRTDVQRAWLDELKSKWGEAGSSKVALLEGEQQGKNDLLSILIHQMSENHPGERRGMDAVLDRVRSENYSIKHFLMEVECLENVLMSPGGSEVQPLEVLNDLRKRLGALLRAIVEETWGVYEQVLESGARGFCLFKADGTIVTTNEAMNRILDTRSAAGKPLASFFNPPERALLQQMLSMENTGRPRMWRSYLRSAGGAVIPVGIEIAPLSFEGGRTGGYLCAVDLSLHERMERKIFDKFPLGITKQTLKEEEFTYMNPAALRLLGFGAWEGKTLRDVFPDEKNYSIVRRHLESRSAGKSEEYEVQATPAGDAGRKILVSVTAVPETDFSGKIIRSLAILRDLTLERACERIHGHLTTIKDAREMLTQTVREVFPVIPFERFVITLYSADMSHLRDFYSYDHAGEVESNIRWWPIPAPLMEMLTYKEASHIDNLEGFLNQPGMEGLRNLPEFVKLLKDGFRSSLTYPVVQGDRVVAGISLLSKQEKAYGKDQESLIEKLPLDKAVSMALHYEEIKALEFRLNLVQKIVAVCGDFRRVAETIVDELAGQRQWEHISLFRMDEKNGRFILLRQKALDRTRSLPEPFALPLGKNVLTRVYSTGEPVNIPNVLETPLFRDLYEPSLPGMLSELCLPIAIGGKVCWLLNIEDSHQNAFSKEEVDALLGITGEICHLLDRVWLHHFLESTLKSTSDLVFVTNRQGKISRPNPESVRQLGYSEEEMAALELKAIFEDPREAQLAMEAPSCKTREIKLRRKDGSQLPVLLSGSELKEEFEGKVFVCKDVSMLERVRELEYLSTMYHEIALQTQTPLSLAFGWIRRLKKETGDRETAETLDKALKQLTKVEMTYNRLALYDRGEGVIPYSEVLLSISEVVDHVLSEFPQAERDRIAEKREEKIPYVRGDLFQLTFCFEAILSFLLRYLPLEAKLDLRTYSEGGWVITKFLGFLPDRAHPQFEGQRRGEAVSKTIMQMALGDEMIQRFVHNHKGEFFRPAGEESQGVFEIRLPAAPMEV